MRGRRHAPAALYPRERHGTRCTGGWMDTRAGLYGLYGFRSPDLPSRSQSLYRLSYRAHKRHNWPFLTYIRLYVLWTYIFFSYLCLRFATFDGVTVFCRTVLVCGVWCNRNSPFYCNTNVFLCFVFYVILLKRPCNIMVIVLCAIEGQAILSYLLCNFV